MNTSSVRAVGAVGLKMVRAAAVMSLLLIIADAANIDLVGNSPGVRLRLDR